MFIFSAEANRTSYPKGIGVLSTGLKRPGREASHPPPCNANTENALSYASAG
jgi:hypothetical protein